MYLGGPFRFSVNSAFRTFPLVSPSVAFDWVDVCRPGNLPDIVQHVDSNIGARPPAEPYNQPTYVQSRICLHVQPSRGPFSGPDHRGVRTNGHWRGRASSGCRGLCRFPVGEERSLM